MYTTIIIEDEKPAARRLQRLLQKLGINTKVMLHSITESVDWLQNNPNPDLIFLDIQLSDGLSFEIFDKVQVKSAIIFTTAYDKYALKAFKLNSVDYLLKPIDIEDLQVAVEKFKKNFLSHSNTTFDITSIKDLLKEKTYKKRFTIQIGQHLKMFETSEVACFYSEDKSSYAYTENRKSYPLDDSLETIFEQLNPDKFFKVNRKFIVNIDRIKDIISYTNSRLQIKLNGFEKEEIIVSRERVKDFKNWLS